MNPQATEQSVRPPRPLAERHGAVRHTAPPRLVVVEERTLQNGVTPPHWTQPAAEHLAHAPGARRISMVESVAIQIFSGAIEFSVSERNGLAISQGVGQRRWPLMLNRSEICEYLGASWRTLKNVLTVRPVDMGANMIRYNRRQIDAWAASRPPMGPGSIDQDTPSADHDALVDTAAAALIRAGERGSKR
ncbi:hypothetical protein [Brevundimonas sp. DC300-4]|uniref:hypothetical protein n=1 Tax=Brevundimonas sp. DC300-4 TaxID=2804594 RepID=UPI003CF32F2A